MNDREDEPDLDELDDEALSWDGDDDVVRGDEPQEEEVEKQPQRGIFDVVHEMSLRERVITAGFLLLSLAWAAGWGVVVAQNPIWIPDLVVSVMYEFGEFLAIAGAPVAMIVAIQLTRGRTRMMWLIGVAIITFPWPLVLGGIS
ncbi:hypothetical protein [uncultured Agrococcus sp.]|uniref:hypothetical protein n=1 Tax=uncultured Agrococcus sp. TaxID=382258 RepID=UPI0025D923D1|nr:hypothetical protein [uncultured Agrococcus sp.]